MTALAQHLRALDGALVARAWPDMSPFWWSTFDGFLSRKARRLVLRAGRRAGKSSSLCRLAVAIGLYGDWHVAPGDLGVVAFISVSRDEASQRLRTIKAILDVLRIGYTPIEGGVEVTGWRRPVAFKTFAATLAGVVGFTAVAIFCDEVARWRDSDSGANPAREVIGSVSPALATTGGPIILSSSPLGRDDAHAVAFALGDTEHQMAAHAPTWIANPTVTEAETHELEPDERIWRREYLAEPQAGVLAAFDADAVARAFVPREGDFDLGRPLLVMDPSSGKKDSWTWAIVQAARRKGTKDAPHLRVSHIDGIAGSFWRSLTADDAVGRIAACARANGITTVHADQREEYGNTALFSREKLAYCTHPWTAANKPQAVELVRRWFADWRLDIVAHDRMRSELLAFEERITSTGSFTFGARGSAHDDYVALLVTAALADIAEEIPAVGGTNGLAYAAHRLRMQQDFGPRPRWPIGSRGF